MTDLTYAIDLPRLKEGRHHFEFTLDEILTPSAEADAEPTDAPPPGAVSVRAQVTLDKSARLLDLRFALSGHVELACDRCLEPYPHPVEATYRIVFSHDRSVEAVNEGIEGADDVQYLPASTPRLDLRQELFDLLSLQLPLRRVPPDCPGPRCPPEVLRLLEAADDPADPEPDDPEPVDPRWAQLKSLRNSPESS